MAISIHEIDLKNGSFSPFFRSISWMDMAIVRSKTCYNWPKPCAHRFLGPLDTKNWKEFRKKSKNRFFSGIFHGWIWPFPDLKPVPIGQKWYSLCPQWGILMGKFVPKGFWVHWTQKIGRIWEKVKNLIFRTSFQAIMVTSRLKKSDLNAQFWCSLAPWWGIGICKVVSQCLFMFSRQLEGSKMTSTKICHFSLISIR